jgi:hypothetical protein
VVDREATPLSIRGLPSAVRCDAGHTEARVLAVGEGVPVGRPPVLDADDRLVQ